VGSLAQDLRFAARMLAKEPGTTLAALLSLALAIGSNTTIFTWASAVLLEPLLGVLGASRLLRGLLFGMSPADPVTFAGVAALLGAVAAVACSIPARRATRIDPIATLRTE
jgi:ABC-type antimicrobial peptide transport system permease subunit